MKSRKPLSLEEFKFIYSKAPRVTVDLIINNNKGVLLTKRAIDPGKNLWHLPGGTVLYGNSIEETIQKVAKDELGTKVKIIQFIGFDELFKSQQIISHTIALAYLVKPLGDIKLNAEASAFDYFENLPEDIIKDQKEFLQSLKKTDPLHLLSENKS